jgi:hypothetical protein
MIHRVVAPPVRSFRVTSGEQQLAETQWVENARWGSDGSVEGADLMWWSAVGAPGEVELYVRP